MFLYPDKKPETLTFAPSTESAESADRSAADLWDATRDLQTYRDNANAEWSAKSEAYERRNKAIFEATGLQLDNPMRYDPLKLKPEPGAGGLPEPSARSDIAAQEQAWQARVQALAAERPEFAGIIDAGRPILADAYQISQDAEKRFGEASADPALGGLRRTANLLGGGIAGMLRDPLQIATLWAGGGIASPARGVAFRILQTMFTEAAVNGGVEAGLQLATQDFRRRAGVEHGWQPALEQIGLAAAFGGGFGGLLAGAGEVLRLTGKSVPPEILSRAVEGNAEAGDIAAIGEALGLKLDAQTIRTAELAAEQPKLDAAAFGPPPAGIAPHEAEALAARTVRQAEDPPDLLPDMQERFERIERIVKEQQPLGREPKRPVTLMQFLAGRSVKGIRDESGELAASGLSKKFVPGGGALVRAKGKPLDRARELAAEAGYFDAQYGDPERAIAESTPDDLLRLLRQEAGGDPVLSPRADGGRQFEWLEFEQRQKAQEAYRQLVSEVDSAAASVGLDRIDDAVLVRAAELVDGETDAVSALERALDEDYRSYADALSERGEDPFDDTDIPFFEDTPAGARAGGADGRAGGEGRPAGSGADEAAGQPLPGAGSAERAPLRAAGDTPEPATPEAAEAAGQALVEAGGPTGDVIDLWDAMPAARQADGTVSHVTHAQMIVEADRDEFFGDLIASCKD